MDQRPSKVNRDAVRIIQDAEGIYSLNIVLNKKKDNSGNQIVTVKRLFSNTYLEIFEEFAHLVIAEVNDRKKFESYLKEKRKVQNTLNTPKRKKTA